MKSDFIDHFHRNGTIHRAWKEIALNELRGGIHILDKYCISAVEEKDTEIQPKISVVNTFNPAIEIQAFFVPKDIRNSFLAGFQGLDEEWRDGRSFLRSAGYDDMERFKTDGFVSEKWISLILHKERGPALLERFRKNGSSQDAKALYSSQQAQASVSTGGRKRKQRKPRDPKEASLPKELNADVLKKIKDFSSLDFDYDVANAMEITPSTISLMRHKKMYLPLSCIKKTSQYRKNTLSEEEFYRKIGVASFMGISEKPDVPQPSAPKVESSPESEEVVAKEQSTPPQADVLPEKPGAPEPTEELTGEIEDIIQKIVVVIGFLKKPDAVELGVNALAKEFFVGMLAVDFSGYPVEYQEESNSILLKIDTETFLIKLEKYGL